jgi:adenine-specific DNA-methyltransferase
MKFEGLGKDESLEKLQNLLKTLFELGMPELDFGIYRIMNYRRREVEEFIEKDLVQAVEKAFEQYRKLNRQELVEKIRKKREEIERLETQLGEKILRNDNDIEEKFRESPLAKEYLELKNSSMNRK